MTKTKVSENLNISKLYHVDKKNIKVLETLLTECFEEDPLYKKLIPNERTRKRLLPELFECDLEEFFCTCEIYADSEALNGMIVVCDETRSYNKFKIFLEEMHAYFKTNHYLIKEDPSLKTFYNFVLGKDYLNSKWTEEIQKDNRLHIIYLAVRPSMQHHGISSQLIGAVLEYAREKRLVVSLETHNEQNVKFYQHFGFQIFRVVEKHFNLKQYCLVYNLT